MTGPEHYAEAERLLVAAGPVAAYFARGMADGQPTDELMVAAAAVGHLFAEAQVHATLALAAVTDRGLAHMRPATDGLAPG